MLYRKCDALEAMLDDMRKATQEPDNSTTNISDSLADVTVST